MFNLLKTVYKYISSFYYPPKRKAISPKLRQQVWEKVNHKSMGVCYCCNDPLHIKNMHVAHNIPHAKGGTIQLSNLYPTCMHCNLQCGKKDLFTYKRSIKRK